MAIFPETGPSKIMDQIAKSVVCSTEHYYCILETFCLDRLKMQSWRAEMAEKENSYL